jgi:hypothetical protein
MLITLSFLVRSGALDVGKVNKDAPRPPLHEPNGFTMV